MLIIRSAAPGSTGSYWRRCSGSGSGPLYDAETSALTSSRTSNRADSGSDSSSRAAELAESGAGERPDLSPSPLSATCSTPSRPKAPAASALGSLHSPRFHSERPQEPATSRVQRLASRGGELRRQTAKRRSVRDAIGYPRSRKGAPHPLGKRTSRSDHTSGRGSALFAGTCTVYFVPSPSSPSLRVRRIVLRASYMRSSALSIIPLPSACSDSLGVTRFALTRAAARSSHAHQPLRATRLQRRGCPLRRARSHETRRKDSR